MKSLVMAILLFAMVAAAAVTDTFFAVHCEPTHVAQFNALVRMVALADSMNMYLTIELSPPYADTILATPSLLSLVRSWQLKGHEIAAHHHDLSYHSGWDGYTNHPASDILLPERYRGTMNDFFQLLSRVAGDSLLMTGGITDWNVDWPVGLPYRTEGHNVADALGLPENLVLNGQKVISLNYGLVNVKQRLDSAMVSFNVGTARQVLGLVQHESDFASNSSVLRNWLVFLKGKGVQTKTVRTILRNRGVKTAIASSDRRGGPVQYSMLANYPNPFNTQTVVQLDLINPAVAALRVVDLRGAQVAVLKKGLLPAGHHSLLFDASALASGEYLLVLDEAGGRFVQKMTLLR
jgi:hypothetical protein